MGFNTNKHNCQGPHIVFKTGLKDPQKKIRTDSPKQMTDPTESSDSWGKSPFDQTKTRFQ